MPSLTHIHSEVFSVDFHIQNMGNLQIRVGFMLQWNVGLNWGFYGNLGLSPTVWSYDPSKVNVVTNTESIEGELPKILDGKKELSQRRGAF